jgi:hypothetical protein
VIATPVQIRATCQHCGEPLLSESSIAETTITVPPCPVCSARKGADSADGTDGTAGTDTESGEGHGAVLRAARFVLDHHDAIRHALTAQIHELREHAAELRRASDRGGTPLLTAQAAADTASRKEIEADAMQAAMAALAEIVGH